jgi:hypothetical protein
MLKTFRELSEEDQDTAAYLWDKLTDGSTKASDPPQERRKPAPRPPKPKPSLGRVRISFFPLFLP